VSDAAIEGAGAVRRALHSRLGRRVLRVALVLVALRVLLWLVTPLALSLAARSRGLECEYEELSLSLLRGRLAVHELTLRPLRSEGESTAPIFRLGALHLDIDLTSSLFGTPRVSRFDLDGCDVDIEIDAHGRCVWTRVLGLDAPSDEATSKPDAEREPLELPVPPDLRAQLLRMRLRVTDASATPPVELELVADARVGIEAGRGEIVVWLHAPKTLESARLETQLAVARDTAAAESTLSFRGLDARAAQGWLARVGVEAIGEPLAGSFASRVQLEVLDPVRGALAARFRLNDLRLEHGSEPFAGLDSLNVAVGEISGTALALDSIVVDAPFLRALRDADGRVQVAGLAPLASASATESVDPSSPSSPPAPAPSASAPKRLSLGRFVVAAGRLEVEDRTTQPATALELRDATARVEGLRWNDTGGPHIARFAFSGTLPGLCDELALDGDVRLDATAPELKASARADGLTLERLRPHLAAAGLESELRAGAARARLAARVDMAAPARLDLDLEQLQLTDGAELFALERIRIRGLAVHAAEKQLVLDELSVAGLRTELRRDAGGVLHALGLALHLRPRADDADTSTAAAAPNKLPFARLTAGALRAERMSVAASDETSGRSTRLALRDAGFEATQLDIGSGAPDSEGVLRAWLACDDAAQSVKFTGRLATGGDSLRLSGAFEAEGLDARPFAPYTAALGLEPTLEAGSARAQIELSASHANGAWSANAELERAELVEHDDVLVSVAKAAVLGLQVLREPVGVAFERLEVESPFARVERDQQGRLGAFGIRIVPVAAPSSASAESPGVAPLRENKESVPVLVPLLVPLLVRGGGAALRGLHLEWRDRAVASDVEPAVELAVRVDASASEFEFGSDGAPAQVEVRAAIDEVLGEARAQLQLHIARHSLRARGELSAEEITPAPLAAYLPAGLAFDLQSGQAHLREFEVELAQGDAGAFRLEGSLAGLAWRDRDRDLLSIERAQLDVPTLDAAARAVELRKLDVSGIRTSVVQNSPTSVSWLGLELREPAAAGSAKAASPNSAAEAAPPAPGPRNSIVPRVSVGELRIELAELLVARPDAAPAALSLSVEHRGPSVWLSPDPEEIGDIVFVANGALQPLVGGFEARATAAPFAASPSFSLEARLHDLRGAALTELAPQLAAQLDGSALEHGEIAFELDAQLDVRRRGPLELDPSADIGFRASLSNFSFKSAPDGAPLAGLAELRVEGGAFSPRSGAVRIASVEIERPMLRAQRDEYGLHALGFTLVAEAPVSEPEPPRTSQPTAAAASPVATALDENALPDVSLERIVATGIDVELLDTTGTTPARVPLDELDAELGRFSLRGLARGEALSFRATLGASDVALPPRLVVDSLLEGVAAGVGELLSADSVAPRAAETRPLFAEVTLSGKLAPFPAPTGWAALNVEALELPAFRGPAGAMGLEVGDGLADLDLRLRFSGASGLSVDARSSFTHLSLSEPADGPLARYLALPAPLDTVLFLLKDAEGRHKVSIGFRATNEGLSTRSIVLGAAAAIAEALARAVASSPLRLLSTLTDAVGVTGDAEAPPPAQARRIEFASGDASLPHAALRELESIASQLDGRPRKRAVIVHELSGADLERTTRLVNPTLDDCARLTARLRERKAELALDRDASAARARAEFALGDAAAVRAMCGRVRELESQLGQCDQALERVFELSRPGAERRAAARARSAAIALGGERIERARRALLALGVEETRIVARVVRAEIEPRVAPETGAETGPETAPETARELAAGGALRIWVR
jgi:hypothetical protein